MVNRSAWFVLDVERVLERYLLVGLGAFEVRNSGLHGLEIEMIKRVLNGVEEFSNGRQFDEVDIIQFGFDDLEVTRIEFWAVRSVSKVS